MRPLDPRLVSTTRPVRVHLVVTVIAGVALTVLILAQAWLLSRAITGTDVGFAIAALAGVAVARAILTTAAETAALRSATRVVSDLRRRLIAHVTGAAADPTSADPGELATLAGRGLDAMEDYVARYLPQLVLAVLVPLTVLGVIVSTDWVSALIIAFSLPCIPVFMILVGWQAQAATERQWSLLERLGGQFLDAVEGLPTLAVFRRAKATAELVRTASLQHRAATMATLRIAFLSALVLELVATLSVALVAVAVGLRLLYGELDLATALLVLILAPEAYLPVREVGARFHASIEGITAAQRTFAVLDGPGGEPPPGPALPVAAHPMITVDGVTLRYPDRDQPALDDLHLHLAPGSTTVLVGPSGAGKSSLLALLLRFREPTAGTILVTGADGTPTALSDIDRGQWRRRVAWVPQHPYLFDASLSDNIRLGAPEATDDQVRQAAARADLGDVVAALPDGYATRLGERGSRLSAGQRQRVALARAFLVDAPIVLLDEPTAHLDPASAARVRGAVERLARGRTLLVVAHDEDWQGTGWDVHTLEQVTT